jgi:aryl-alcohol dehydrogenase-like predicted oxidoreductase
MVFGSWGGKDHDDSIRTIHHALDAGTDLVNTAGLYAHGEAEEILGTALTGGRRDEVVPASEFRNPMSEDANDCGNSCRWVVRVIEGSLEQVGTDHRHSYQAHRPQPGVAIEETARHAPVMAQSQHDQAGLRPRGLVGNLRSRLTTPYQYL